MAKNPTAKKGAAKKAAAKAPAKKAPARKAGTTAPQAAAGEPAGTVAAKTQAATTKENVASTTRANDPNRESNAGGPTTAEKNAGQLDPDAPEALEHVDEQATGNRHSHPAETTAERTARLAAGNAGVTLAAAEFPAGEDADPAVAGRTDVEGAAGVREGASSQDESGALQDATRSAIGAGGGAPDGVGDDGEDPSQAEADAAPEPGEGLATREVPEVSAEPIEPAPGGRPLVGKKAQLWRMLEVGATEREMRRVAGQSVKGMAHVMARANGRELSTSMNDANERVYKLVPVAAAPKAPAKKAAKKAKAKT